MIVVCYAATWATFKPELEINKKIHPEKYSYISVDWTFWPPFPPPPPPPFFLPQRKKYLAPKNFLPFQNCCFRKFIFENCIFKILFSKNSNFISFIYSSSESSEELSKSSIICLTSFFLIYVHSFKKTFE